MGERTEGMKKQAQELIEQAYQRGYKAGYEEGKGQTWSEEVKKYEIEPEKSLKYIEQGRNEAWEAARKVREMGEYSRKWEVFPELGDGEYPFDKLSASETIARIQAYEEQKKQEDERIEVGDEVRWLKNTDCIGIVTHVDYQNNMIWIMGHDGRHFIGGSHEIEKYEKTGRHFSDMDELIKKMQEGE